VSTGEHLVSDGEAGFRAGFKAGQTTEPSQDGVPISSLSEYAMRTASSAAQQTRLP